MYSLNCEIFSSMYKGTLELLLAGSISQSNIDSIKYDIEEYVLDNDPEKVRFDLGLAKYIDYMGISLILSYYSLLKEHDKKVTVVCADGKIKDKISSIGIDMILDED